MYSNLQHQSLSLARWIYNFFFNSDSRYEHGLHVAPVAETVDPTPVKRDTAHAFNADYSTSNESVNAAFTGNGGCCNPSQNYIKWSAGGFCSSRRAKSRFARLFSRRFHPAQHAAKTNHPHEGGEFAPHPRCFVHSFFLYIKKKKKFYCRLFTSKHSLPPIAIKSRCQVNLICWNRCSPARWVHQKFSWPRSRDRENPDRTIAGSVLINEELVGFRPLPTGQVGVQNVHAIIRLANAELKRKKRLWSTSSQAS